MTRDSNIAFILRVITFTYIVLSKIKQKCNFVIFKILSPFLLTAAINAMFHFRSLHRVAQSFHESCHVCLSIELYIRFAFHPSTCTSAAQAERICVKFYSDTKICREILNFVKIWQNIGSFLMKT